jgi:hypothetical protein
MVDCPVTVLSKLARLRLGKYTHVPWDRGNRHFMDESE